MSRPFVAFDLDGTLEDSRADMVAAAHRVRAALDLRPRDGEAILPHVNKGMPHLYQMAFDDYLGGAGPGSPRFLEVKERYEADYLEHVADRTCLYEGVAEAVASLSERATLACVTNKPERISRRLLEVLGLGPRFASVVGGDTLPESKPHPSVYRHALAEAGTDPEAGPRFMVGDTAGDMRLARAVGATSIWCRWGYVEAPGDERPDHVAEQPSDLLRIYEEVTA